MQTSWRVGLAAGFLALAGPIQAKQSTTFSSSADLVVLHVSVSDRRGAPVGGLDQAAFRVFEDGWPQPIRFLLEGDTPASIGLLIDSSASMFPSRSRVIAAATAFLDSRRRSDEVFALAFNDEVRSLLPSGRLFTNDLESLRGALDRGVDARGRTALYDAILAGLDQLSRGARQRRVLVVVGDGGDNASRAGFENVLMKAQASDTVIYAVALSDPASPSDGKPAILRRLAAATGGLTVAPARPEQVARGFDAIARDIRSGYTLAYAPEHTARDGRFRHTRVDVAAAPGRPKLSVRTRPGYVIPAARPPEEARP